MGQIHRNTFIDAPRLLGSDLSLRAEPRVWFAGQISGVEGYVESAASGYLVALAVAARRQGRAFLPPPGETALGALYRHVTGAAHPPGAEYQPSNVTFGLFPPLARPGPEVWTPRGPRRPRPRLLSLWIQCLSSRRRRRPQSSRRRERRGRGRPASWTRRRWPGEVRAAGGARPRARLCRCRLQQGRWPARAGREAAGGRPGQAPRRGPRCRPQAHQGRCPRDLPPQPQAPPHPGRVAADGPRRARRRLGEGRESSASSVKASPTGPGAFSSVPTRRWLFFVDGLQLGQRVRHPPHPSARERPANPSSGAAAVSFVTVSPNGKAFAFVDGGVLRVAPLEPGSTARAVATEVSTAQFTPDGAFLVVHHRAAAGAGARARRVEDGQAARPPRRSGGGLDHLARRSPRRLRRRQP